MERKYGDKFIAPILAVEFVGSALLMLAVNLAGDDLLVVPLTYFALIVCCYDVSGGYLNPAVTLGVFLAQKRYVNHLIFMIVLMVAQSVGCLFALGLGYLLRVTVEVDGTNEKYLEPNVYARAPPLILTTDGMPSYGQMMLSETIASFILVLTAVSARSYMQKNPESNVPQGALVIAAGLAAVQRIFRETSGGIANPSVVLAKIVWQEFTLSVDRESEHSQWTYEYAASFSIGPLAGSMLAGVCFNMMNHVGERMRNYKKKGEVPDDSQSMITASAEGTPANTTFQAEVSPYLEQNQPSGTSPGGAAEDQNGQTRRADSQMHQKVGSFGQPYSQMEHLQVEGQGR